MFTQPACPAIHQDYVFYEKRIINSKNVGDRLAHLEEYPHFYDFYDSFRVVLNRCTSSKVVEQELRIDKLSQLKTDDEIWDELEVRNCTADMLVDRLIALTQTGKEKFPLIIGYFEDKPAVVEPGYDDALEVRLLERHSHYPNTYIAYAYKQFKL
jgi:hypothetical protein